MKRKINRWKRTGSYNTQTKLPQKDNRNIYENNLKSDSYYDKPICEEDSYFAPYVGQDSRIRVPSLKRKSAWKRFYKLYPTLKGQKVITGHGVMFSHINKSMIKLKKVKK